MKDIPAFPTETEFTYRDGMTLRDYFAAKAMQGIMNGHYPLMDELDAEHKVAKAAYIQADAMLKAREQ